MRYLAAIIFLIIATLSACTDASEPEADAGSQEAVSAATDEATPEASEPAPVPTDEPTETLTPEASEPAPSTATQAATETATEEPTDSVTPEVEATQRLLQPNNGNFTISVSYTLDRTLDDAETMDIVIVSALSNLSTRVVSVAAEDIYLVDEDDNRYEPELPDSTIRPPIVGAEVAPNESLLGMVLFRLPPDVVPAYLEWCIAGDCEQAIQAPIP